MTTFTPGTRVVVRNAGHLNGKTGVVVGEPMQHNDPTPCYDIAIVLDEDKWHGRPLGFYSHELAVAK